MSKTYLVSFWFVVLFTSMSCGQETDQLQAQTEDLLASKGPSDADRDSMKEMFAKMQEQQDNLMRQQEELKKLTEQQQQQQMAGNVESGVAEQDENAGKFGQQGTLEKITKKDGSSFYTRIVSSEDQLTEDWGPEYDVPEPSEGDAGDVAVRGNHDHKPKTFTMPAGRDMKEVLKEIMANDGDVRKVPGLKPWRPENDKRNENQLGWDDDEGVESEAADSEEIADDGNGVVPRQQAGAATSLSEANHEISMLKIDLQTLKQEKVMKEKSSSLQVTNLNQKLRETSRAMEDMKVQSKREKDEAIDLKRRVDGLEEEAVATKKSLADKDATIEKVKSELEKAKKEVESLLEENREKDTEWNKRWMERHSTQEAAVIKSAQLLAEEKKNTKKVEKKKEKAEAKLAESKTETEKVKKELEEAKASTKRLEEEKALAESDAAAAKEATANAQIDIAAIKIQLDKTTQSYEETTKNYEESKEEFKKEHNMKLLLEETVNVLRGQIQQLKLDLAAAKEGEKSALASLDVMEADLAEMRVTVEKYLPMLLGLAAVIAVFLLCHCLKVCCCAGGKVKAAHREDHPDVKSSKSADVPTQEPTTSKKSKKKEKKNE